MREESNWFDKNNLRVLVLFVLAFLFIYLDNINQKNFKKIKSFINDIVSQSSYIITWPARELLEIPSRINSIIILQKENKKKNNLKTKIQKLIIQNNFIRLENKKLKKFLNEEQLYSYETIQAKIISTSKGIFSKSITINKGVKHGIKNSSPIIKNNYLIGQVIEANFNSSRVILLTDINSRVPILVGENLTQAILVGDPSVKSKLSLQYLPRTHKLKHGDRIYTSNIDGILKKGILIGSINQIPQIDNVEKESLKIQNNNTNKIKIKQNFEIQLGHDPYQLDYVSIFIDKK